MKIKSLWVAALVLLTTMAVIACSSDQETGAPSAPEPAAQAAPAAAASGQASGSAEDPAAPAPAPTAAPAMAAQAAPQPTAVAERTMPERPIPVETETVQNVWGETVEKPQYGGMIVTAFVREPPHMDNFFGRGAALSAGPVVENLGMNDWATHPDVYKFPLSFTPLVHSKGNLAESWEISPDNLTLTYHLRKGRHWHDKAPMNGREFTAEDVKFNFDRQFATGSGFSEVIQTDKRITNLPVIAINAVDKYTVELKLERPSFPVHDSLFVDSWNGAPMNPPEVIREHGDVKDWENLVGTGPYMVSDWVIGTHIDYTANPNYEVTDERHPEMRIPFSDKLRMLIISDHSTRIAAIRSGKMDVWHRGRYSAEESADIRKSNPELMEERTASGLQMPAMNVSKEPFDDLRVRQAMQLAVNYDEIKDGYFQSSAEPWPSGVLGPMVTGYFTPFPEWPEEIRSTYQYDPERAKQLLSEAGYSDGFTFSYNVPAHLPVEQDIAQILKAYWAEIGAEAEITLYDGSVFMNRSFAGEDQMTARGFRGSNTSPWNRLSIHTCGAGENFFKGCDDEPGGYDDLIAQAYAATDRSELERLSREASLRFSQNHWIMAIPAPFGYNFAQPRLKGGWWNQATMGGAQLFAVYARLWLDPDEG